jgi:hypothetical protein
MSRLIILAPTVFDWTGDIALDALESSSLSDISRRSNRIATLDGGAVFNDTGHSAADRIFRIAWDIESTEQWAAVARLVRLYPLITVSSREGVFSANPQELARDEKENRGRLRLMIYQQLTEA